MNMLFEDRLMPFRAWIYSRVKKIDPTVLHSIWIRCQNPETVFMSEYAEIEENVMLCQGVQIRGQCKIGKNTVIDSNSIIAGSIIGANCRIHPGSIIAQSLIGDHCEIGPYTSCELSHIGENSHIGFTAQIKRSQLGAHTNAKHHCYIGDTTAEDEVNFGAGCITANYDGMKKLPTVIKRGAFIGTNVNLIAPCIIGHDVLIAAGTTLRKLKIEPYVVIFESIELGKHMKVFQLKTERGYEHVRLEPEFHALLSKAFDADLDLVYEWLTSPNTRCGNRMPLELILKGEKECLESILESIAHSCCT